MSQKARSKASFLVGLTNALPPGGVSVRSRLSLSLQPAASPLEEHFVAHTRKAALLAAMPERVPNYVSGDYEAWGCIGGFVDTCEGVGP